MQRSPWRGENVLNWKRTLEIIMIGVSVGGAEMHVIMKGMVVFCCREEKLIEQSTVLKEEIRRLERSRYVCT